MIEIISRSKNRRSGRWVEGYYVYRGAEYGAKGVKRHYILTHDGSGFVWNDVFAETIGRFTNLLDVAGKRIFEGDIVRAVESDDKDLVGKIEYNCLGWVVNGTNWADSLYMANQHHRLSVIGNIHDNPELLMEAQNECN